ncbi:hypothetical protein GPJ61_08840 [Brevibacillus formosus]|uniref:hypothetical protein n=1 Tax=Brevibacillus formosus TaxID=54913 RepID=UPI001CA52977|nr:hypothetical protein [Brevibacillus formosus]MBW5467962.1 hypothetical protein [Brevibacillus formosus]
MSKEQHFVVFLQTGTEYNLFFFTALVSFWISGTTSGGTAMERRDFFVLSSLTI